MVSRHDENTQERYRSVHQKTSRLSETPKPHERTIKSPFSFSDTNRQAVAGTPAASNSSAIAKELISIPRKLFIKDVAPLIPCEQPSAAPTPQEHSLLNSKHRTYGREESRKEEPPYRLKGEFLKNEEQYERLRNAVSKAAR